MVKVYGPMMSMDASGTLAKAATFSKWKGRNYVRQRVIPANPKSGPQTGMRSMLKFLSQKWASLGAGPKATWVIRAASMVVSPFNAFCSYNQSRWRQFKAPTDSDPATELGVVPAAPTTTPTGGVHQISLSIADGAQAPDFGWLIYASTVTGFTPGYDNLIAVVPYTATPTVYVHAPLVADDYYYRIGGVMKTGLKGTLEVQRTAAAT